MFCINCGYPETRQEAKFCASCGKPHQRNLATSSEQVQPAVPTTSILPEGTQVLLQTLQPVSSAFANIKDRFELTVAEEVRAGKFIFIRKGERAVGTVIKFGPGCTFTEPLPDTATQINWPYQYIGIVDTTTGEITKEQP
jgi:hypothetical protein